MIRHCLEATSNNLQMAASLLLQFLQQEAEEEEEIEDEKKYSGTQYPLDENNTLSLN